MWLSSPLAHFADPLPEVEHCAASIRASGPAAAAAPQVAEEQHILDTSTTAGRRSAERWFQALLASCIKFMGHKKGVDYSKIICGANWNLGAFLSPTGRYGLLEVVASAACCSVLSRKGFPSQNSLAKGLGPGAQTSFELSSACVLAVSCCKQLQCGLEPALPKR